MSNNDNRVSSIFAEYSVKIDYCNYPRKKKKKFKKKLEALKGLNWSESPILLCDFIHNEQIFDIEIGYAE